MAKKKGNICEVCGKKMPAHIIPAHMKKSHPVDLSNTVPIEVEPQITPEAASTEVSTETPSHLEFDWNKAEKCASCGEIHPSLLMRYHAHIVHGV